MSIELFSRRWSSWEPERIAGLGVIEAAVLCERLAANGSLDLGCHLALCLVRGAVAAGAGPEVIDGAGRLFESYAEWMLEEDGDRLLGGDLDRECGPSAWVSYHVRCTRVAEIVGLLALRVRREDKTRAAEIAD